MYRMRWSVGPGPGLAGDDEVVQGAGEEEPEGVGVDVRGDSSGVFLGGQVVGEDVREKRSGRCQRGLRQW